MKIVNKHPEDKCCSREKEKYDGVLVGLSKPGPPGKGATIEIQSVVTIEPSDTARVENAGDESAVKLVFYIPKGDPGNTGPQGKQGEAFTYDDFTAEQLEELRGKQGPAGYTPKRGIDYWTPTDIAEVVEQSVKEVKEYVDETILGGAS